MPLSHDHWLSLAKINAFESCAVPKAGCSQCKLGARVAVYGIFLLWDLLLCSLGRTDCKVLKLKDTELLE